MNTNSREQMLTREGSRPASAEQRLKELGIKLPAPRVSTGPFGCARRHLLKGYPY
jgi:hypothetical protein